MPFGVWRRQIFMWLVPSAATVTGAEGDAKAYADSSVPGFVVRNDFEKSWRASRGHLSLPLEQGIGRVAQR